MSVFRVSTYFQRKVKNEKKKKRNSGSYGQKDYRFFQVLVDFPFTTYELELQSRTKYLEDNGEIQ